MTDAQGASSPALEDTDRARIDLYALLARLYYGGPDAALLAQIARATGSFSADSASPLVRAWLSLAECAATAGAGALQQEYDDLLVGTGKAAVSPYATFYLVGSGREKALVELRDELDAMGLKRKETSREPEDHFAGLFDVMRHLAERGSTDAALQDQRRFFQRYIEGAYPGFCDALLSRTDLEFYGQVAALTLAFLDIERESLCMS